MSADRAAASSRVRFDVTRRSLHRPATRGRVLQRPGNGLATGEETACVGPHPTLSAPHSQITCRHGPTPSATRILHARPATGSVSVRRLAGPPRRCALAQRPLAQRPLSQRPLGRRPARPRPDLRYPEPHRRSAEAYPRAQRPAPPRLRPPPRVVAAPGRSPWCPSRPCPSGPGHSPGWPDRPCPSPCSPPAPCRREPRGPSGVRPRRLSRPRRRARRAAGTRPWPAWPR